MEKQGIVSVFVGIVPRKEIFENYLRETYDPDGDGVAAICPLWQDLGVNWLDHDFQDAYFEGEDPVPLDVFLSCSVSYLDSFRSGVVESCIRLEIDKVNAGLFLYNFQYPATRPFPSPYLQFIGSFPYTISHSKWLEDLLILQS
jgi:hypothetical protein